MAHKEFIDYLKNLEGGPVSTVMGFIMFIFGGVMIYVSSGSENTVTWASIEVIIFAVGLILLLKSDKWLKKIKAKNKNENPEA